MFAIQSASLLAIGRLAFEADLPSDVLSLVLTLLLGAASFAGLGLAAASLIRSAEGSSAAVNLIILPMAFLTGAFGPTRSFPDFLQAIAEVLPLKHFLELMIAIFLDEEPFWSRPASIAIVAAWGIGGIAVAAKRFAWEPREA